MISIVIPVCDESECLPVLHERLVAAASSWNEDFECILVDDGSRDRSLELIRDIAKRDPHFKGLSFSRNFGHQSAVTAGLCYATGDVVAVMDSDLQDPPEELQAFFNKCRDGYDVVYAIRTDRQEGFLKRTSYWLYYRFLRSLASVDIALDSGDFCVMSRRVVDDMNALPERNRFVRGLRTWVGYRQAGLEYKRPARQAGEPKYTYGKLMNLALDGLGEFLFQTLAGASHYRRSPRCVFVPRGLSRVPPVRYRHDDRGLQSTKLPGLDLSDPRHLFSFRNSAHGHGNTRRVHRKALRGD